MMSEKLDFEGRRKAEELLEWVINEPEEAAFCIAALQAENAGYREQLLKLKQHLGPDGEYAIHRADGEPMSWESMVIDNIFEELDALLAEESER
jgi:hypothetical protein